MSITSECCHKYSIAFGMVYKIISNLFLSEESEGEVCWEKLLEKQSNEFTTYLLVEATSPRSTASRNFFSSKDNWAISWWGRTTFSSSIMPWMLCLCQNTRTTRRPIKTCTFTHRHTGRLCLMTWANTFHQQPAPATHSLSTRPNEGEREQEIAVYTQTTLRLSW